MKNYFILLFLCQFSVLGQIDIQIEASRSSGVAPLYVFFDATLSSGIEGANDTVNTDFLWNFDTTDTDPNGIRETSKGMVSGYVFEHPGVYTVQCLATDPDGNTDIQTIIITVNTFAGTTFYVSEDGNDANNGTSEETPWQTAAFALQQLSGNEQLLFRRGDTFDTNGESILGLQNGPILIGTYGTGDSPILFSDTDEVLDIRNSADIRIIDLHLIPQGNGPFGAGAISVINNSENIVALRLEIEQSTGRAIYQDESKSFGVFDSYLHDFGVIGVFSGRSSCFSFVGNRIDRLVGTSQPEHGIRIQGGEKQFLAHNTLTNLVDTKTAITIRGDGQRHVMIYKNSMDRLLGINPQNAQTIAAISEVVIEGNYIGQNADYIGQAFGPSSNGINIEATNIAIRNNVIDGYRNAVFVGNDGNGVLSGDVDMFHNTINWRPVSPESGTSGRIVRVRGSFNVSIRNNVISVPSQGEGEILNEDEASTNIVVNSNMISDNPNYIVSNLPDSAADQNDILNYLLTDSSPVIDQGTNDIPVFFDALNTPRHEGTNKDVGAFEYISSIMPVEENNFVIYPNPVKNHIIISNSDTLYDIIIIDINGKKVLQKTKDNSPIDVSHLSDGFYFLVLKNDKKVTTHKIIKQSISN
ncbi:T9SS type A sorting domain-containing protein [Aquimarina sediminis]|uniref:T9SS type A sorting domain-containing protein n=1 Tax=Aquimarina sediminis TaxID=2070536 RepID=UPI000CA019C0|nr:T9SS type A sorting domain-containing protein [Aquimarina sediminis]